MPRNFFCFIGGLAVQNWSELRATKDVDLTLLTGFGNERPYIDELLAHYQPRRPDAADFAERRRVLLLQSAAGIGIDIAMGAFPYEALAIERSRKIALSAVHHIRICTAEDLTVFKAFASRPQGWRDIEMTIVRQGDAKLDWPYILKQLTPLAQLKEDPPSSSNSSPCARAGSGIRETARCAARPRAKCIGEASPSLRPALSPARGLS